jgi:hypothetical protein
MAKNDARKNKDWYEDEDVLNFIKSFLGRYTPVLKKNIITAFKEFIDKFEKLELLWDEWEVIYRAGRSPEEITNDILYPVYENTSISLPEFPEHKRFKPYLRKKGRNHKSLLQA